MQDELVGHIIIFFQLAIDSVVSKINSLDFFINSMFKLLFNFFKFQLIEGFEYNIRFKISIVLPCTSFGFDIFIYDRNIF